MPSETRSLQPAQVAPWHAPAHNAWAAIWEIKREHGADYHTRLERYF